ncbi:hypothetical protein Q8F55_001172 [Vanrija albida]|uniref:EamA domain-containing protein n=1 Tax=Vanrija albida TaxID=181172 RepID=A0ABR3QFB6_9TREE
MRTEFKSSALIGVAIACAGNILISLALTVQKLAHIRVEAAAAARAEAEDAATPRPPPLPLRTPKPAYAVDLAEPRAEGPSPSPSPPPVEEGAYLASPLWWLGLGMIAVGEAGNFLSYGFAPASVVAPLGTVALIANVVFSPLILGESFTRRNLLGTGLAILGAVTVVWSSRDSNPRLSPDQLIAAVTATPFLVYTALNIAVVVPLVMLSSRESYASKYIGIDVGACALFGGYTVMATKALSSLMSSMLFGAFKHPVAWGAVVVLIVTSVLQIKFLNRALMRFDSNQVIPTQFVFFSLAAIVGSAVLYQEFRDVDVNSLVNFGFGIAFTFLGVYFLTTPQPGPNEPTRILAIVDEEAPLLLTPGSRRGSVQTPGAGAGPVPGRLVKRPSATNISSLALNSQAGLLLLATTPPVTPGALPTPGSLYGNGSSSQAVPHHRPRSGSRASVASEATARRGSPLAETGWPSVSSRLG